MNALAAAGKATIAASVISIVFFSSCGGGGGTGSGEIIKKIPLNSHSEVIARKNVTTDSEISRDGNGSLRIDVMGTQTHKLFRLGDIDLENALLIYQAAVRTEDLDGEVFLEMICFFQSKGEFFSRNFDQALSGTNDWKVMSTPFRLLAGQNPDVVELNICVSGSGTVWIDDIRLLKRPLE